MAQLLGWTFYFVFLAAIILIGWEQPLKVQFGLKPATPPPVAVAPQPPPAAAPSWMNDSHRWDKAH